MAADLDSLQHALEAVAGDGSMSFLLPLFAMWVALACVCGWLARMRGRSAIWWGLIAFVNSPVLAGIALYGLPSLAAKTCPHCAEQVKREAVACRHCGFDFVKVARPSAQAAPPVTIVKVAPVGLDRDLGRIESIPRWLIFVGGFGLAFALMMIILLMR